jgi:ribosomal protein S12 methylthiotransferase accessory factor
MDFYRLSPGIDAIPLGEKDLLLYSDSIELKLEGESARLFGENAAPLLREWIGGDILRKIFSGFDESSVTAFLNSLEASGALQRRDGPPPAATDLRSNWRELLQSAGLSSESAAERLRSLRVTVVGLEAAGAYCAIELAKGGIGKLILADPFPCSIADSLLMPPRAANLAGASRQDSVASLLNGQYPTVEVATFAGDKITKEAMDSIVASNDLVIVTYDRGFSIAHQWANRSSIAIGTPTLHAVLRGHRATVGPLVLPGESPCYLCWSMRRVAALSDFDKAMTVEEHFDAGRLPAQATRPTAPFLSPIVGGILAAEAFTLLLGTGIPKLVGHIIEVDALRLDFQRHAFLQHPHCPACSGNATAVRKGYAPDKT